MRRRNELEKKWYINSSWQVFPLNSRNSFRVISHQVLWWWKVEHLKQRHKGKLETFGIQQFNVKMTQSDFEFRHFKRDKFTRLSLAFTKGEMFHFLSPQKIRDTQTLVIIELNGCVRILRIFSQTYVTILKVANRSCFKS